MRKRLLLVEDDLEDIELLRLHLEQAKLDADVEIARDGVEAWAHLTRCQRRPDCLPDVIVADIKMPRMTGLELLCRIAKDPELSRIPFFFLTSSSNEADRDQAARCGARAYLTKPIEFGEYPKLAEVIKRAVDEAPPR